MQNSSSIFLCLLQYLPQVFSNLNILNGWINALPSLTGFLYWLAGKPSFFLYINKRAAWIANFWISGKAKSHICPLLLDTPSKHNAVIGITSLYYGFIGIIVCKGGPGPTKKLRSQHFLKPPPDILNPWSHLKLEFFPAPKGMCGTFLNYEIYSTKIQRLRYASNDDFINKRGINSKLVKVRRKNF